jgi:iron complex transport system substrate-binding protein
VIIDAVAIEDGSGRSQLPAAAGWSELRAVKQGHVARLASDAALRPGPRIADGLADVARTLHGGTPP